jgi:putative addiction module component (TIGR02574 family)
MLATNPGKNTKNALIGQKEKTGNLTNGLGKYVSNGHRGPISISCGSNNVVRIKTTQCCQGTRFLRTSTAVIGQAIMTAIIRMLGVKTRKNNTKSRCDSPPHMAAMLSHEDKYMPASVLATAQKPR